MRSDRRLLRIGADAVSLGLAGTALGFGFAALGGLAGLGDVAMIGEMIGAPSMMILFTLGWLVLGIALLRTDIVSRTITGLMAAIGPGMILGVLIGVTPSRSGAVREPALYRLGADRTRPTRRECDSRRTGDDPDLSLGVRFRLSFDRNSALFRRRDTVERGCPLTL